MTTSLANLDFGEQSITIYGTQNDPLIKCSDLLIHVLGYKDCKSANWFRKMADNPKYVILVNHQGVSLGTPVIHRDGENVSLDACGKVPHDRMFTERGIYTALMKSNKPIAE